MSVEHSSIVPQQCFFIAPLAELCIFITSEHFNGTCKTGNKARISCF